MALWHQQVFEGKYETSEFHRRILEEYPGGYWSGAEKSRFRREDAESLQRSIMRATIQVPWMEEGYPDRTEKGTNMSQA